MKNVTQSQGRKIVYRYNGDPKNDETLWDKHNDMPLGILGSVIERNGRRWKVAVVRDDLDVVGAVRAFPIHRVFLTNNFSDDETAHHLSIHQRS